MEIPGGIIAFAIIVGIAYWVNSRSEEKAEIKASHLVQSDFMSLVSELDIDGFSDDMLNWLDAKIRMQTGSDGLQALTDELSGMLREEDGLQQAKVQLMLLKQRYSQDMQIIEETSEWLQYIRVFKQMNKAQQDHEIERLKKAAASSSSESDNEKINALELIHLGNADKTTDVMVGGVKLFTLKEK